jgi:hypothetical protein
MHYIPLPERFKHHRELVGIVAKSGIPAPARWTELSDRLDAYLTMDNSYADALAAAVINPTKTTDLPLLRALAAAEQSAGITSLTHSPQVIATINGTVVAAVETAMAEAIAPVAADNYRKVAELFNTAAAAFTTAAQAANAEADARTMVTADDAQRQAWLAAEVNAATLTDLIPPLLAAAQLTGLRIDLADERINEAWWSAVIDPAAIFGLTVDAGTLHRRRAWDAFNTEGGRCGRWSALIAAGARIRAAALDDYAPYRRSRPLIHQQQQIIGELRGTVQMVTIDPEDDDYKPTVPPADPVRQSRLTTV